jgi:SAM-dependent methyltransferase
MAQIKISHLPYVLPTTGDRFYFYENYWKRVALRLLEKKAGDTRGWSFLDYGCGRGESMAYAKELGMRVKGLDVDPECVRLASQYGEAEVLNLDQPDSQVPPQSFDVIACFHVLEHVENPKSILTLLSRGARKYVLVAVPNLGRFPNLRRPWKKPAFVNRGHLQSWDHDHFKTLCEVHCGLRVVDWGFDATIIPPFSEIARRLGGERFAIFLETKIFRYLFPYAGISIIALLAPDLDRAK